MMIGAVDESYIRLSALECLSGSETAKSRTNDNDPRPGHIGSAIWMRRDVVNPRTFNEDRFRWFDAFRHRSIHNRRFRTKWSDPPPSVPTASNLKWNELVSSAEIGRIPAEGQIAF